MTRSLANTLWMRFIRVQQKIAARGEVLIRAHGLNGAQFGILSQIAAARGITQNELAESLRVTKGNISQLVEKLERDGLIERRAEGTAKRLFLTDAGAALVEQMQPEHDQFIDGCFAMLSADELMQLGALLRKVDRALE